MVPLITIMVTVINPTNRDYWYYQTAMATGASQQQNSWHPQMRSQWSNAELLS